MTSFDEYQRFLRYKYGSYSFNILLALSLFNFFLTGMVNCQWGETKELEYILLIFVAVYFFIVMNTYKGSFFDKKENPRVLAIVFFLIGLSNIYLSLSPHSPIIVDGLVTSNSMILLSGITWFSLALAYLARVLIDKRRDKKD